MFRQLLCLVCGLLLWSFFLALPLATIACENVEAARELDYCPNPGAPTIHDVGADPSSCREGLDLRRFDLQPDEYGILTDRYGELGQMRMEESRAAEADELSQISETATREKVEAALTIFELGL